MPHDLRYQHEPSTSLSERDQRWFNAWRNFENDPQRYIAEMEKLAENGSAENQIIVGRLYSSASGLPNDYDKAEKWFRRGADGNPAKGNWYLGVLLMRQKKDEAALEAFKTSAEHDYAPAYYYLGSQYYFGRGVPKDLTTAKTYLRRAYDLGSLPAGYLLASLMIRHGKGILEKLKGLALSLPVAIGIANVEEEGRPDDELFYGFPKGLLEDSRVR